MAVTPRLDLRQSQTLVMTPQLQQAIKLLQYSHVELFAFIEEELEKNPMLEHAEPDRSERGDAAGQNGAEASDDAQAPEQAAPEQEGGSELDSMDYSDMGTLPGKKDAPLDTDDANLWSSNDSAEGGNSQPEAFSSWGSGGSSDFANLNSDIEQTLTREVNLRDHLINQLGMDFPDPADRAIGLHLIDMLNEAGYLSGEPASVAEVLGCEVARVEEILEKLRGFDPPGIFARDLADCLALQLRDLDRLDPAIQALLDNLDLLAKRSLSALKKACAVDDEDLTEMVAEIRSLNPKPAHAFDHDVAQPITPDVLMRTNPKGGWIIELNNETLPRILVNNSYHTEISRNAGTKKDKEYISEQLSSANWLVKSLHQRATTILKVASEIVRQQDSFFIHGIQHLKPLILRDIAEAIEMHESTVSRVTANKYIATPRGNFELKYFFTSAIAASTGGEAHSAESVRYLIKGLIENETAKEILSDDRIVEMLRSKSIDIARRTVAKYREVMRIPSSIQRRREKSSGL